MTRLLTRGESCPPGCIALVCRRCGQYEVFASEDFSALAISANAVTWVSACCRMEQSQDLGPTLDQEKQRESYLTATFGRWDPAWAPNRPTLREYLAGVGVPNVRI